MQFLFPEKEEKEEKSGNDRLFGQGRLRFFVQSVQKMTKNMKKTKKNVRQSAFLP